MYASLTDAEFRAFYEASRASLLAGSSVISWKAGDTEVTKSQAVDWSRPQVWASIDAEYCARFGSNRTRYSRTRPVFSDV